MSNLELTRREQFRLSDRDFDPSKTQIFADLIPPLPKDQHDVCTRIYEFSTGMQLATGAYP